MRALDVFSRDVLMTLPRICDPCPITQLCVCSMYVVFNQKYDFCCSKNDYAILYAKSSSIIICFALHADKYSGGNPVHPRETPVWQKEITCFFQLKNEVQRSADEEDDNDDGEQHAMEQDTPQQQSESSGM